MISKREFFEMYPNATEADWKRFCYQMDEILERVWNEDHPLTIIQFIRYIVFKIKPPQNKPQYRGLNIALLLS